MSSYAKTFLSSNVGAGVVAALAGGVVLYVIYKSDLFGVRKTLDDTKKKVTDFLEPPQWARKIDRVLGIGEYNDLPPPVSNAPYRMEGTTGTGRSMIPSNATPGIVPEYIGIYDAPDYNIGNIGAVEGQAL
jgi:hypothetical protein